MRGTEQAVRLALILAVAAMLVGNARAQQGDARVSDLAQAGRVRVGVGVIAPHWAVKDQATGELRGVAIEIARALASRLGVELVPVEYPSPPRVLDGLQSRALDLGFLAIDPSRASVVDFSPPYLEIDATYLVPDTSPIYNLSDVDQPGVRIAVAQKSVEEIVLSRTIKRAELRGVDTLGAAFDLLRAGNADVLAAPRPTLIQFSTRVSGFRVLDDRFNTALAGIAVPKGQEAHLSFISDFVEEAKASGLVQQAIERTGVRGVQAVASEHPRTR